MTTSARETLTQQANTLASMHAKMQRQSHGQELQILKHLVYAMEVSAKALSLPKIGSAPLFIGLSTVMNGIYTSESSVGMVGPSLANVIEALSRGVVLGVMPTADAAQQEFLKMLCTASYTALICLGSLTAGHGVGPFPNSWEAADLRLARIFSFEMSLKLLNSTAALTEMFSVCIEACGGNRQAQRVGAAILSQVGGLFVMLAGAQEARIPPAYLVGEESLYLKQGVKAAAEALARSEHDGTVYPAMAVAINQLQIALDDNREEEVLEALQNLLESLGTSLDALHSDLKRLNQVAATVVQAAGHRHDEEALTGIINVI